MPHKRQWRQYETRAGNRPVKKFLAQLSDDDAASVTAAMKEVQEEGLKAASQWGHLRGSRRRRESHLPCPLRSSGPVQARPFSPRGLQEEDPEDATAIDHPCQEEILNELRHLRAEVAELKAQIPASVPDDRVIGAEVQ